jgi:hypothetical protein
MVKNMVKDLLSSQTYLIKSRTHDEFADERAEVKLLFSTNIDFYADVLQRMFEREMELAGSDEIKINELVQIYVEAAP